MGHARARRALSGATRPGSLLAIRYTLRHI